MAEIAISSGLVLAMIAYTLITNTWGRMWRPHYLWAEYVVGALLIVGATALWARTAPTVPLWSEYEGRLTLHYFLGGLPVIIGQIVREIREREIARRKASQKDSHATEIPAQHT